MRTIGARASKMSCSLLMCSMLGLACAAVAQNAPASTVPPTKPESHPTAPSVKLREGGAKSNFKDFERQLLNPWTLVLPAMTAGIATATGNDHGNGFDNGWTGYGERYGVFLADTGEAKFIRAFAMPTIFNQVERYRPVGAGNSFGKRFGNAMAHTFVTKTRNGNNTVNMSGIPASFAVAGIGSLYYPGKYSDGWHTVRRGLWLQAGYFSLDAWREFRPEICRAIHMPCGKRSANP